VGGIVVGLQDGKVKIHAKVYSENLKRPRRMWSQYIIPRASRK
jgi:hypothetical protein